MTDDDQLSGARRQISGGVVAFARWRCGGGIAFARWRSYCALCGDLIEIGEPIAVVGGGWAHEVCFFDEAAGLAEADEDGDWR